MNNRLWRLSRFAAACAFLSLCAVILPWQGEMRADGFRWVVEKQGLRMREAPDQKGKLITVIPYSAKVEVLGDKGDPMTIAGSTGKWTEVKWNAKKGWVFGGFLGDADPAGADRDLAAAAERYWAAQVKGMNLPADPRDKVLKFGARIKEKSGTFAVMETGFWGQEDRVEKTNTLWAKSPSGWKIVIEDTSRDGQRIKLFHLNNDDLADAVVEADGSDWTAYTFYLAKSADTVKKIDGISVAVVSGTDVTFGRCEKARITGYESNEDFNAGKKTTFIFDCATNRFRKVNVK